MVLTQSEADELWAQIEEIPVAMMATLDEGRIRSRPMHRVQKAFSGKLWFFTDLNAAKTDEIDDYHQVGLSFEDTRKQIYVSASGTARIVRDRALVDKFWNPMVGAWFPEGKDDPNVGLLEVAVHQAEAWDAQSSRMIQLFKMGLANMRNETPDVGEHHQYGRH